MTNCMCRDGSESKAERWKTCYEGVSGYSDKKRRNMISLSSSSSHIERRSSRSILPTNLLSGCLLAVLGRPVVS